MKKVYSKPQIVFEDFSLSTNIAGDCTVKTHNPSNSECGYPMTGLGTVFLTGMGGCSFPVNRDPSGDGEFNGICYHVPYGENLFNS